MTRRVRTEIRDRVVLEEVEWAGRMEEAQFLARIWDLTRMPSGDSRCTHAAEDIRLHRSTFSDWEPDWVFDDPRFDLMNGPGDVFLRFAAEMVNPVVRPDRTERDRVVATLNTALMADGWSLQWVEDGLSRYVARPAGRRIAAQEPTLANAGQLLAQADQALREHLARVRPDEDPGLAVGASKEVVETVCKLVLDARAPGTYATTDSLIGLYKKAARALRIEGQERPVGDQAAQKIVRALTTQVEGLAELRNKVGTGHGRSGPSSATVAQGRLAANCARAVSELLLDVWHAGQGPDR